MLLQRGFWMNKRWCAVKIADAWRDGIMKWCYFKRKESDGVKWMVGIIFRSLGALAWWKWKSTWEALLKKEKGSRLVVMLLCYVYIPNPHTSKYIRQFLDLKRKQNVNPFDGIFNEFLRSFNGWILIIFQVFFSY